MGRLLSMLPMAKDDVRGKCQRVKSVSRVFREDMFVSYPDWNPVVQASLDARMPATRYRRGGR